MLIRKNKREWHKAIPRFSLIIARKPRTTKAGRLSADVENENVRVPIFRYGIYRNHERGQFSLFFGSDY